MLRSGIYRHVRFAPMDLSTVLEVIPRYHPVYADVEQEVIAEVDDRYAHGTFRHWASFTHSVLAQHHGKPHGAGRTRPARAARLRPDARGVTGERRLLTEHPDLAHLDQIHARAREDDHVVLIVPTPGRGGEGIARDILRALGKRFDLPRTPRDPQALLKLASTGLSALRRRSRAGELSNDGGADSQPALRGASCRTAFLQRPRTRERRSRAGNGIVGALIAHLPRTARRTCGTVR